MEIFFNELSATYPCKSLHDAKLRMSNLLYLLARTKKEGFIICRIFTDYFNNSLADNYSISNWLQDSTVRKVEKDFFLSYVRPPYEVSEKDQINQFIIADYLLNEPDEHVHNESVTEGLAWAYICNTFSISYPANDVWKKTDIGLVERSEQVESVVNVHNASELKHIDTLYPWIETIKTITLIPGTKRPEEKRIHLRDDHGKDVLQEFARKVVNSEYVEEIPQSLEFKPRARSFIQKIYPDGRVDVTLFEYDEGYSLMILTTGRNLRETETIAKLLKEKYYS